MSEWEYKISRMSRENIIAEREKWLNDYGDEGWELVTIDYGCAIFKRVKE